ncbi:hypothetical protein O6H91_01G076600 [Diphasiastrum complanatum]|uniref:Uncharacterized protein n=2 Tax=Diphasiastrum complanatum TaxID=34168 RepID=A0ACC2ESF2_DIPCM|nr:hypothetical protein O6H91_01G076600 [Diphasiastrum complanatum]KAJ7569407.1 hypothetical protein O6H91_01G076600 [Diphasiastrum complanatum]
MDEALVDSDSEDEIQRPNNDMEGFDDFTISSSWERLIAAVEAASREWRASGRLHLMSCGAEQVQGLRDLYRVQAELVLRNKQYRLEFFFQAITENDRREDWRSGLHHLQLWFGVSDFLLISPISMSGVLLDASEATMLLSAVAVALSNCGSMWPVFVPVHDPTRKAYTGIQGTISSFSTRFDADRLCTQVPVKLMHLEGLYDLFMSKVAFTSHHSSENPSTRFGFTMKLTYGTPMPGFEYVRDVESGSPKAEQSEDTEVDPMDNIQWDEECPWAEWHSAEDPVKGFELVAIWSNRYIGDSVEMAEFENASTFEADKWLLTPILSLEDVKDESVGFAGRLRALVNAFCSANEAEFVEDYATAAEPSVKEVVQKLIVPPPTVLDRVLKDLFYSASATSAADRNFKKNTYAIKAAPPNSLLSRFCLHALWFGNCNIRAISVLWIEFVREVRWCWEEVQLLPRISPDDAPDLGTCLLHQKLQLLAKCVKHKSEKAVIETKSFSRSNSNKEEAEHPVGIGNTGAKNEQPHESRIFSELEKSFKAQIGNTASSSSEGTQNTDSIADLSEKSVQPFSHLLGRGTTTDVEFGKFEEASQQRKGSAGRVGNLLLLKTKRSLHAPHVQVPPIMTEDMLQEREHALATLDRSPSGEIARLRLQSDIIASDMAAFKAANPGAVFEDFVRWHSPRDWVEYGDIMEGCEISESSLREEILPPSSEIQTKDVHNSSPSGKMSRRMSEPGNLWDQIWKNVRPIPASEQRPLFDYIREGEKVYIFTRLQYIFYRDPFKNDFLM